ncbi:hypothetical protein VCRA2120E57_30040 [Vibrio crassostreae]|nr:hypothetical protein VCRA2120E57_30040 [Vibrio crassostreae]
MPSSFLAHFQSVATESFDMSVRYQHLIYDRVSSICPCATSSGIVASRGIDVSAIADAIRGIVNVNTKIIFFILEYSFSKVSKVNYFIINNKNKYHLGNVLNITHCCVNNSYEARIISVT